MITAIHHKFCTLAGCGILCNAMLSLGKQAVTGNVGDTLVHTCAYCTKVEAV